ncbi:hypothetical protein [Sorangium sp. So ce385]|uniref:hypothetical protein n=1 Tax=Sorangium sp. So ce385 TaxID=3133308 RepID=UPI003F5B9998
MTPKAAAPAKGGNLSSYLPAADYKNQHDPFRVGKNRIRNPKGKKKDDWGFPLKQGQKVPLFDGIKKNNGSKNNDTAPKVRRGYIRDKIVRLNWGTQKTMPYKGRRTQFVYAWYVKLEDEDQEIPLDNKGRSGWVPLLPRYFKDYLVLKRIVICMKRCVDAYERSPARSHPRKSLSSSTIEYVISTIKPARQMKYNNLHTTRKLNEGSDRADHYLPRTPDRLSRDGYVNLCYNLPEQHGMSTDTVRVGTSFFACVGSKKFAHRVSVPLYKIKKIDGKNKSKLHKQRLVFIYGYITFHDGRDPKTRRYGWISRASLKKKKTS